MMRTLQIELAEQTYQALRLWAKDHNRTLEDAAQEAIDQVVLGKESATVNATNPEDKIRREAEAWRTQAQAERSRYLGEFVAVHEGRVVDHDPDRRQLYLRVREKWGTIPILITSAEASAPREYRILSPQISTEP
jgi:plasmid stability protein